MRPTRRLLLALGALVVASAACGDAAPTVAEPSTTTTPPAGISTTVAESTTTTGIGFEIPGDLGDAPLVLPPVDAGTLLERRWIDRDSARATWTDPMIDPSGITFTLDACRIRYPGQWAFDVTVDSPADVQFPITLGLDFGWGFGDEWTGAPPLEVVLSGTGAFTVTYDYAEYVRDHIGLFLEIDAHDRERMPRALLSGSRRAELLEYVGAGCDLEVGFSPDAAFANDRVYLDGAVVADLAAPTVTATEGTVEHLAQTADLADRMAPGRQWAQFYGHGWAPTTPVIWLLPDRAITSIEERWTFGGRCPTLLIQYFDEDAGDPFELRQYRTCASDGPGADQPTARLVVGEWTIVVGGQDQAVVDDAITRLEPYFVTNPLPEPTIFQGTTIAETEFEGSTVYLVELDYGDGIREVLLESPVLDFSQGPQSGANGETFRGCWQTTVYEGSDVALVLVGDPSWIIRVGGTTLYMHETDNGIGYALMRWTSNHPPHVTLTTADGSAACS